MYQFGKKYFILISISLLIPFFQNCSKVAVNDLSSTEAKSLSDPTIVTRPQVTPPPTLTEETLKTIQPALAVRGISCLLCHAEIRSNIITDFGLGTSEYLGGSNAAAISNWYTNGDSAWQLANKISGTVFVPDAPITPIAQESMGESYRLKPLVKIKEWMTTPITAGGVAMPEMAIKIIPEVGNERVIAKSKVVIRAPSISEIEAIAPDLFAKPETSGFFRVGSSDPVQFLAGGAGLTSYTKNDEGRVLECSKGDIVIKGTLLLRRLKVNAGNGCRLYVSGSVFIEGAITYVGQGPNQNIQISSASAIVMGIGYNELFNRLVTDSRGLKLASRNYTDLAKQITDEAQNIGNLQDAIETNGLRTSIDFKAVLLNAPIVHSRYLGMVSGTIIAESALFALENFHFTFDPVFTKVSVLPLLKTPVLSLE